MRSRLLSSLLFLLLLAALPAAPADAALAKRGGEVSTADACNPHPDKDDIVLPMPGGLSMAFRPVSYTHLPLSYRAELFGIIWNNQPKFQQLFLELCQALEALGNPAEADCPLEALLPRQTSIIDVALLAGLGTSSAEDRLTLLGKDGRDVYKRQGQRRRRHGTYRAAYRVPRRFQHRR